MTRVIEWHGQQVAIPHPYERDPHSGAGNCWCGHREASTMHPHRFVAALRDPERCVCGKGLLHPRHIRGGGG